MMLKLWIGFAVVLVSTISAAYCARPQPKGVIWYKQHPYEMGITRRWCADNPGLAKRRPDCDAALTAWLQLDAEAMIRGR
jgi:hypothetical protein